MATVLLVDASPLIYAAFHGPTGRFCTTTGIKTGLRYGFLRAIRAYEKFHNPTKVVICYDVRGKVLKAANQAEYKANRPGSAVKDEMYAQVPELKDMLALTHYTQVEAPGYEADDLLGTFAVGLTAQGHDVVVVTTDNDMAQLSWRPNVKVWVPARPARKDGTPATKAYLQDEVHTTKKFGVDPSRLLAFRAIVGDTSDNIPGVVFGAEASKRVATTLSGYPVPLGTEMGFDQIVDAVQTGPMSEIRTTILMAANLMLIKSNLNVMCLAHVPEEVTVIRKGESSRFKLMTLFEQLEFKSLYASVNELALND